MDGCPVIEEYFDVGTIPTEYCELHYYEEYDEEEQDMEINDQEQLDPNNPDGSNTDNPNNPDTPDNPVDLLSQDRYPTLQKTACLQPCAICALWKDGNICRIYSRNSDCVPHLLCKVIPRMHRI